VDYTAGDQLPIGIARRGEVIVPVVDSSPNDAEGEVRDPSALDHPRSASPARTSRS